MDHRETKQLLFFRLKLQVKTFQTFKIKLNQLLTIYFTEFCHYLDY